MKKNKHINKTRIKKFFKKTSADHPHSRKYPIFNLYMILVIFINDKKNMKITYHTKNNRQQKPVIIIMGKKNKN